MDDLKVFRIRGGCATEVPGVSVAVERELQSLVEANMDTMLGIRFLATEYPTGQHGGRVDSLGLDENGNPVIVEYKRSRDRNVTNQALSYLYWLQGHRHEFENLVKEKLGAETAKAVDWSNPRLVCVAGEFSRHDKRAVQMIGHRIDLLTYRVFNDVLALQMVASVPGRASGARSTVAAPVRARGVTRPAGVKSVQQHLDGAPQSLQGLYADLDEMLLGHEGVRKETQLHYVAYRRIKNLATVRVQSRQHALVVNLRLDPDTVKLEEGFTRDLRGKGCVGVRDGVELRLNSPDDLRRAAELLQRSVEAA
ncbi:transporter [Streptomyces sp. Ru73]|uniref:DUF5655 domain-containing protein n=1 Tax=Streptomyces sp. Ru73 TaxID=2080748 RepID=UPI000CDD511B|nr:DUF5655 domain-containing protein [Streptomyces sp. Ru73]POX43069.1 transporter [Streptomyces sp. Ru73]